MKRIIALVLSLCICVGLMVPAFAAPSVNKMRDAQIEEYQQHWDKLNIDKNTQKKLAEKIKRGEILDSMNPEKIKPIAHKLRVSNTNPVAEYTFPDGSKIIRSITPVDTNKISPLSLYADKWVDVKEDRSGIYHWYKAYIHLDLEGYGNDYIIELSDNSDDDYSVALGVVTDYRKNISQKYATSYDPATAYSRIAYTKYDGAQPIISGVSHCYIFVCNGSYYSDIEA